LVRTSVHPFANPLNRSLGCSLARAGVRAREIDRAHVGAHALAERFVPFGDAATRKPNLLAG